MIDPINYYRCTFSDPDQLNVPRDPALSLPIVGNIQDSWSEVQTRMRLMSSSPPNWPAGRKVQTSPSQRWQLKGIQRTENGPWAEYDNLIPGLGMPSLELVDKVTGSTDMSRYLLCPPNVIGFDLRSRQWRKSSPVLLPAPMFIYFAAVS